MKLAVLVRKWKELQWSESRGKEREKWGRRGERENSDRERGKVKNWERGGERESATDRGRENESCKATWLAVFASASPAMGEMCVTFSGERWSSSARRIAVYRCAYSKTEPHRGAQPVLPNLSWATHWWSRRETLEEKEGREEGEVVWREMSVPQSVTGG